MKEITLGLPGSHVQKDNYFCASFLVEEWMNVSPVYMKKIRVSKEGQRVAHHIILQGCSEPYNHPGEIW